MVQMPGNQHVGLMDHAMLPPNGPPNMANHVLGNQPLPADPGPFDPSPGWGRTHEYRRGWGSNFRDLPSTHVEAPLPSSPTVLIAGDEDDYALSSGQVSPICQYILVLPPSEPEFSSRHIQPIRGESSGSLVIRFS